MKVSIIISSYNGEQYIRSLLNSIQELEIGSCELEVILRDDSSSDDTVKIVEQEYKWVDLVHGTGGNVGFVKSNNIALQRATGDVICCVNQDTILHPSFIVEGVRVFQRDQHVFGVNTNMIMPWVMTIEQFRKTEHKEFPAYEYQLTPYGFVQYVEVDKTRHQTDFMTGGGFFIRRSIIMQDGYLFDPCIDMYCEDTELSLRLQRLGRTIIYCPQAIIYHNQVQRSATTLHELNKLVRITRNRFLLFARKLTPVDFTRNFPLYLVGIVKKMSYLGLPSWKRRVAYVVGVGIALVFFCLYPYWILQSSYDRENSGK